MKKVITAEANILITKALASGEEGDTGAEDNAWNSPTPALAAIMFPEEANAAAWENTAKRLAMNASSVTADATNATLVDGIPVSQWMGSVNLHPDLTMENHGFFNPIYQQVAHVDINDSAITFGVAGKTIPEAFSFRLGAIWDDVLKRLATDEGDFVMPAGQDWTSKDFQHLDYLGIVATRLQRVDASVFESRALGLVAKRQATRTTGSMLGYTQIGYETMLIKRLAALWWTHELFGPSPVPTAEQFAAARAESSGVKSYPYSDFVAARLDKAFVSMSWDPSKPMGLVVPHSEAYPADPFLTYYAPASLVGSAAGTIGAHACDCEADRFSTAGSIGTRRFSMTAFPDGTTLLLDRGTGSTFTYSLEDITGMTGARPVWTEAGDALGALSGNWVNVADRVGMIVVGGSGMTAAKVTGTNNQLVITGSAATGTGNRGAIILPNVGHEKTEELQPYAMQPTTPTDWSAIYGRAEDGSGRLAVARWAGNPMAELELRDDRGAPIPEEDAILSDNTSVFTAHLGLPASNGETLRFFVDAEASLRGQQKTENTALLRNPGEADATAAVTYVPDTGIPSVRQRVLQGGEEVTARVVDGALTLAGPELESLIAARDALKQLSGQLPEEQCDSRHGHGKWPRHNDCDHRRDEHLSRSVEQAIALVEQAISLSQSEEPNERYLAWAIARARWAVEMIEHQTGAAHLTKEQRAALKTTVDGIEDDLRDASIRSQTVTTWVVTNGLAQPGEPLEVAVTILNSGTKRLRNGTVTLTGPEGWDGIAPVAAFTELRPGESTTVTIVVMVPTSADVGDSVRFVAEVNYDKGCHEGSVVSDVNAVVDPIIDVVPTAATIPLAIGGTNQAPVRLSNLADHELNLTLTATGSQGITVDNATQTVTIPAQSTADVVVVARDTANVTGTGQLALVVRTDAGAEMSTTVALKFSDDLALNTVAAPWPLPSATSYQSAYPPSFAFDGNASTFWVSGGTVAGEGPTPASPKFLMVDFGLPQRIGSVTMVPRVGYGPKAYTIEVSNDASTWVQAANVPSAANATVTTALTPVEARYLRLQMTAGWDRIQPPRNVQIIALNVRASLQ
ncbi:MAG: discoidin domain-containing protein [Polyangiaceae bacterium]